MIAGEYDLCLKILLNMIFEKKIVISVTGYALDRIFNYAFMMEWTR